MQILNDCIMTNRMPSRVCVRNTSSVSTRGIIERYPLRRRIQMRNDVLCGSEPCEKCIS
jgi:hypothetical protein